MSRPNELIELAGALGAVVRGQDTAIELLLIAMLSEGHVLVEDVPGVGKTTLARTLARALGLEFSRVQFTPDLLPADISGSSVLDPRDGTFHFSKGPIFTQLLLADEINRASPRTQSALLEAMSERQVTIDGTTRQLPRPFFVVATQNPVDLEGTYPLPEAQLDRFLLRLSLGYPSIEQELEMLEDRQRVDPIDKVTSTLSADALFAMQNKVREIAVTKPVAQYILRVIRATREGVPELELGVSPRGSLSMYRAAQARAFLQGRDFVNPDDVFALAMPVLAHRLVLGDEARFASAGAEPILRRVLESVEPPLQP